MLYHRQLGFPKTLEIPYKTIFKLNYSKHALQEKRFDRYGEINLPDQICLEKYAVVEIETEDDLKPSKILVRMNHCSKYDICIAFIPETGNVKTVWLNSKSDQHRTLDRSKYDKKR